MSDDPTKTIAQAARKLLVIHDRLNRAPSLEWDKLSPAERRFIADTFAPENLEVLRELAAWDEGDDK